jgi:hypothetical protein
MGELHQAELYIANGVICAYFDAGKKPTVGELRANWNAPKYANVSDGELATIIANANKYYRI